MPIASPYLRKTLLGLAISAVVEALIVLSIAEPVLLLFVLGPLAFLAVITSRRRSHLERARRIHGAATGLGAFGIASFGVAFLMHRNNPQLPDAIPIAPVVVPLVQWIVVLFIWISISRAESREKRTP